MSAMIAKTKRAMSLPDTRSAVALTVWTAVLAVAFLALLVADQVQAAAF